MTDSKDQAQSLFLNALEIPTEAERAAYVEEQCGADPELRQEVEELLDHALRLGPFLEPGDEAVDGAIAHPISERPGAVIGPYKLLQQIGEGGMGVVFMAEQTRPVQRTVALKIIKPGMDTRQVIARFEAERQALALMDHPNIARVLDVGATDSGRPYFVMDLVKGVPITDYCDQQHLPVRERLELVSAVCHAVQHAHQKGIIHRDLKPSNVLVAEYDGKPVPKIIDFGVAKATASKLTEKTLFTELGQLVGTVEYMSPEQARFNQLDVDTRSDIYSLGVLVYELLTGSTPFGRKQLNEAAFDEMLRIIREEEPPKPSTRLSSSDALPSIAANRGLEPLKLNRIVQGELDWIVMKALEKDRNRRYETASSLAADIGHHLNDEPVAARPTSTFYRFRKTVRRNKIAFAAASAVVAALVVGLGLSTWLFVRERAARQRAVAAERLAEIDKQRAKTEAAKSEQVAQFMTDMLRGVGPAVALGRDTTMLREILGQTANRLNELQDQPVVEADLRTTLGNVYYDLGQYKSAETMHREALALRRSVFGDEHRDVAASLHDLGEAVRKQDRFSEAEPLLRQALAIRRKLLGAEHLDVSHTLFRLGLLFNRQGDGSRAEPFFRQAQALQRKFLNEEHPDFASSLGQLGIALANQGKYEEAETVVRQSLAIRKKVLGDEHPYIAYSLYDLGRILRDQGKLGEAEAMLRQALAMRRKILGNEHPNVAGSLKALAETLRSQGKLDELDAMNREILTIQRKTLGDEHIEVVKSLQRLGSALRAQGKLNETEDLFREALTIRRKLPVDADPSLEYSMAVFANSLARQRKYAEAEALFREALAICRKEVGEANPMLASPLLDVAYVLIAQGKLPEAEPLYREATALLKERKFENLNVNPGTMNGMAWMLATHPQPDWRDGKLAAEIAKQAVEMAPQNGNIWNTLGVAEYRAGDLSAAIDALEKSMELRNGGDSMDWFFLTMAHWQLGDKDEARKWYDKAVEWMDKNQPNNEELRCFRAEAAELLGITEPKPESAPVQPADQPAKADTPTTTSQPTTDD